MDTAVFKKYFVLQAWKEFVPRSQFRADSSGERHFADEDFDGPPIPVTMCGEAGVCLYGMQTKQRVPCTVCNL